jgi:golgi-specific brefeldin A-resistance guanine nucleotide exchange factor 1
MRQSENKSILSRTTQNLKQSSPSIDRGRKAISVVFELKEFVPSLIESSNMPKLQGVVIRFPRWASPNERLAWRHFCLPVLISLSRQSTNASREVRHSAISLLQRALLGPNILFPDAHQAQVEEIFNRVIFPLLDELLRPHVFQKDPQGMPETRLRASALLCKAFMHFEVREGGQSADLRILWMQILDLLDRLMNIDKGDQLVRPVHKFSVRFIASFYTQYEAVPESLKNVLLVMNAAGILVPPATGESEDSRYERQVMLWSATYDRMERFLPGFLADVIPAPLPTTAAHLQAIDSK